MTSPSVPAATGSGLSVAEQRMSAALNNLTPSPADQASTTSVTDPRVPDPYAQQAAQAQPAVQSYSQPAQQAFGSQSYGQTQQYTQPAAQTYQQPAAQTYQQPAAQTYTQPAPTYGQQASFGQQSYGQQATFGQPQQATTFGQQTPVIGAAPGFNMRDPEAIVGKKVEFQFWYDKRWYVGQVKRYCGGPFYELYVPAVAQKLASYHCEEDILAIKVLH